MCCVSAQPHAASASAASRQETEWKRASARCGFIKWTTIQENPRTITRKCRERQPLSQLYRNTIYWKYDDGGYLRGISGAGGASLSHSALSAGRRRRCAGGGTGASAIFVIADNSRTACRGRGDGSDIGGAAGVKTSQRCGIDRPPGSARVCAAHARARGPATRAGLTATSRTTPVGASGAAS